VVAVNPAIAVAFTALAVGFVVLGGLIGWQIYRGDSRADQLIKERDAHTTTRARLERSEFERKKFESALAEALQRIATLSAAAEKEVDEPVNEDLAPDDVESRRVRAAIKARAAEARRASSVSAVSPIEAVPSKTDSAGASTSAVSSVGSLDPNEVLR
jgi:hypothetical protein